MTTSEFVLSGKGIIYSWTRIERDHAPAEFVDQAPYYVALVDLSEGPRVTAMLTDLDTSLPITERVKIGQPVEMVTRKLSADGDRGIIAYGYKFRPVLEPRPDFPLNEVLRLAAACYADPKNLDLEQAYEDKFRPPIPKITQVIFSRPQSL